MEVGGGLDGGKEVAENHRGGLLDVEDANGVKTLLPRRDVGLGLGGGMECCDLALSDMLETVGTLAGIRQRNLLRVRFQCKTRLD